MILSGGGGGGRGGRGQGGTKKVVAAAAAVAVVLAATSIRKRCAKNALDDLLEKNAQKKDDVYVRSTQSALDRLRCLIRGGKDKLIVVTDFDHTCTSFASRQCHDIVEKSPIMARVPGYTDAWNRLWSDQAEERRSGTWKLDCWWQRAHDIIRSFGFRRSFIKRMLDEGNVRLRPGIKDMFRLCETNGVPIAVVSAGISNFIEEILRREGMLTSNVAILANELIWSTKEADPVVDRFTRPVVHPFSKGCVRELRADFFRRHKARTHVLVLGDSLTDSTASGNVLGQDARSTLSVGFLNVPNEDGSYGWRRMPKDAYASAYDILIENNGSARCVVGMIRRVVASGDESRHGHGKARVT